jgi:hypothetical protein
MINPSMRVTTRKETVHTLILFPVKSWKERKNKTFRGAAVISATSLERRK